MSRSRQPSQSGRTKIEHTELYRELTSPTVTVIGSYLMGKDLGEGSYGKVKMAIHQLTNQPVAIKIVDRFHAPSVAREIEMWKQLRHPNIAQLYEIIVTESKIYMVMEYVSGGELFQYIESNGPLQEKQAAKVFHQLVLAVKYCHDRNVVHRDLKLENIMLDHRENVKLIDFGFTAKIDTYSNQRSTGRHQHSQSQPSASQFLNHSRLLDTYCGSSAYAAPEMISGTKYSGVLTDIWSLGVVLYTLVVGELPFDSENESVIHSKILKADYKWPEEMVADSVGTSPSASVRQLVESILQLEPEKRLSLDSILQHSWLKMYNNPEDTSASASPGLPHSLNTDTATPSPETDQMIHDTLFHHLSISGFNVEFIEKSVAENKCNSATGLYYLLKEKITSAQHPHTLNGAMSMFISSMSASQSIGSLNTSFATSPVAKPAIPVDFASLVSKVLNATTFSSPPSTSPPIKDTVDFPVPMEQDVEPIPYPAEESTSMTESGDPDTKEGPHALKKRILHPEEELLIRQLGAIWSMYQSQPTWSGPTPPSAGVGRTGTQSAQLSSPTEILTATLVNRRRSLQLLQGQTQSQSLGRPSTAAACPSHSYSHSHGEPSTVDESGTSFLGTSSRRISFLKYPTMPKSQNTPDTPLPSLQQNSTGHEVTSMNRRRSVRPATAQDPPPKRPIIQEESEEEDNGHDHEINGLIE